MFMDMNYHELESE